MTDYTMKRGDSFTLDVGPVRTSAGAVQNIAGFTIRFTAKDRLDDADGAAIIAGTGAIDDGPAGLGHVTIPPAATNGFTADRVLHWDLQLADPTGPVKTLDAGKLIVERDVTRASP